MFEIKVENNKKDQTLFNSMGINLMLILHNDKQLK